jgi:hypothetical protein
MTDAGLRGGRRLKWAVGGSRLGPGGSRARGDAPDLGAHAGLCGTEARVVGWIVVFR